MRTRKLMAVLTCSAAVLAACSDHVTGPEATVYGGTIASARGPNTDPGTPTSNQSCYKSAAEKSKAGNDKNQCVFWAIGGNVDGLADGETVMLTLLVNENFVEVGQFSKGDFIFEKKLISGTAFTVAITPPHGYSCELVPSSGTVTAESSTSIQVKCQGPEQPDGAFN